MEQQSESYQDDNMNDSNNSQDNNQSQKQKQKRRTRHDPNHRDFMCGCQRAYLSYPALYTHIKQKHNGIPPEGTAIPQDRGRSVLRAQQQGLMGDDSGSNQGDLSQNQLQNTFMISSEKSYIQHLCKFLKSLQISYYRKQETTDQNQTESTLKDELEKIFANEKIQVLEAEEINYLKSYIRDKLGTTLKEEFDPIREIKKQSLNNLFLMYAAEISKYLNTEILLEIIIFLVFQRRALNKHGWNILELPYQQEFCEENDGESALVIANNLIIDYLPEYFKKVDSNLIFSFQLIGPSEEMLKNAVYLTQNFSYWLYDNHYSNAKLIIQPDDDLHHQQLHL